MESVMLACSRVTGKHTAENITLWYDEITSDFNIVDKVQHIVTDNASNVRKAFLALPGYEENEESDNEDDDDDAEEYEAVKITSDDLTTEHHGCFAHMLQLIVKDGLKKAGQIDMVIKKCSKLVKYLLKSTLATDILDGEKRPQAFNVTRWNSQLKMIRSILAIKLAEVDGALTLNAHDRNILHDIVNILTPFEEACSNRAHSISWICFALHKRFKASFAEYDHSGFVRALFERRMPEYEQNKTYIHAAILDPRFKLRWCEERKELENELNDKASEERKELENELNDKATRLR